MTAALVSYTCLPNRVLGLRNEVSRVRLTSPAGITVKANMTLQRIQLYPDIVVDA